MPVNPNSIAGHVATAGEPLNIKDAYEDARFDRSYDEKTGYRTKSLLCLPICNQKGHVVGVIQAINRFDSKDRVTHFSRHDFELLCSLCEELGCVLNTKTMEALYAMAGKEQKDDEELHSMLQQYNHHGDVRKSKSAIDAEKARGDDQGRMHSFHLSSQGRLLLTEGFTNEQLLCWTFDPFENDAKLVS